MKSRTLLLTTAFITNLVFAQNNPTPWTAQQDHQNMMEQLGIQSLRPGPSGDEKAPNHANYDESLANPCIELPEVLKLNNGQPVKDAKTWWNKRRPELVDLFEREVYGKLPKETPSVKWVIKSTDTLMINGKPVLARKVAGIADNSKYPSINVEINMMVVIPLTSKKPVPVLMMFGRPSLPPTTPGAYSNHLHYMLDNGWGYATIDPSSIQADNGAGLTRGIIGLCNQGKPRKPDDWGSLRAWAWGAARGLDFLKTDKRIDAGKVGIEGVSRYGKAALVTMAFEPRFAVGLIGSSGKGGAALHRRVFGEAVESLAGSGEYHWMAGNYLKYAASASINGSKTGCDLPVDSHELIGLCAPRLIFISYGIPEQGDAKWLDQQGSFMATVAAGTVYKLLGAKDLGISNDYKKAVMPAPLNGLMEGQLAWRQHVGGHTDVPNFESFIPWASKWFGISNTK